MASHADGPGAEFADPERQSLIGRLNSALATGPSNFTVPPDVWAFLWLSDLERLRSLVHSAENDKTFTRPSVSNSPVETEYPPWCPGELPATPRHQRARSLQDDQALTPQGGTRDLTPLKTSGSGQSLLSQTSSRRSKVEKDLVSLTLTEVGYINLLTYPRGTGSAAW